MISLRLMGFEDSHFALPAPDVDDFQDEACGHASILDDILRFGLVSRLLTSQVETKLVSQSHAKTVLENPV